VYFFPTSARRSALALLTGLALTAAACQTSTGTGETATAKAPATKADSLALRQRVAADSLKTKRLALRRDSLRADSIVRKSGQLPGAILPGHRIVAFYGNIRSKGMGILGREPKEQMFRKFAGVIKEWQAADSSLPVMPALHSVTITAQGSPGKDGKWRLMNSKSTIEETRRWAKEHNCILFLDVQVGWSDLAHELPKLEEYLKDPTIHLGIDPEFALGTMRARPNSKVGTYDAKDVNFAINFLARIVAENHLPPKILMVHRYTRKMVTNYKNIKLDPRVQVVMHMDGWGEPTLKQDSYRDYVQKEPVQYTGFKLFYEYDIKLKPHHLMTPREVLKALNPKPLYIQYQ